MMFSTQLYKNPAIAGLTQPQQVQEYMPYNQQHAMIPLQLPQPNHLELQRAYQLQQESPPTPFEELKKKIWEWQFFISTRRKWTFTEHDFEVKGITITGNDEEDRKSMETWTNTTRTLSELVEFYDQGKEFILTYKEDAQTIFLIIQEYTDYVSKKLENSIHLLNYQVKENEKLRNVINDVIKMQNLANRLFPIVLQNTERKPETKGLFGFISARSSMYGLNRVEFNPLEKFGITIEDYQNMDNVDEQTGLFNAIDIRKQFNPAVMTQLRGVL